jgi:hypothetical protein
MGPAPSWHAMMGGICSVYSVRARNSEKFCPRTPLRASGIRWSPRSYLREKRACQIWKWPPTIAVHRPAAQYWTQGPKRSTPGVP